MQLDEKLLTAAQDSCNYAEALVMTCRATGGFKYREKIHGTDKEIDEACAIVVPKIFEICVKLSIAEYTLARGGLFKKNLKSYDILYAQIMDELARRKQLAHEKRQADLAKEGESQAIADFMKGKNRG
jgi:hypothetical protein